MKQNIKKGRYLFYEGEVYDLGGGGDSGEAMAKAEEALAAAQAAQTTADGAATAAGNAQATADAALSKADAAPSAIRIGSVNLSAANWSGSGPYTQSVSISGATITANTKVDIQPDSTAISQMVNAGVTALYIANNNGTLTAYALGAAPTADLTMQVSYYETRSNA